MNKNKVLINNLDFQNQFTILFNEENDFLIKSEELSYTIQKNTKQVRFIFEHPLMNNMLYMNNSMSDFSEYIAEI